MTIFAIHSPFLLPSFLEVKRKGEENNQSRGQKSCLSAREWIFDALKKAKGKGRVSDSVN